MFWSKDDTKVLIYFLIGICCACIIIGGVIGFTCNHYMYDKILYKDAVKYGYIKYNKDTGEPYCIDPEVKKLLKLKE